MTADSGPIDTGPIDLQHIGAGLPIGEYRADLEAGLADGAMVVQAPPGTGKTTFVPPLVAALPATDAAGDARPNGAHPNDGSAGRVIVTQPRRMAARAAARRLCQFTGTRPGQVAAHTVRGESTLAPSTRIEFVTTGVLVRRLLTDPELGGVDAVVLDEVHERHLDSDLLVAMLCELAQLRDDLRLVAMSATLDAERWSDLLTRGTGRRVATVQVPSVLHPLEVRWAPFGEPATDGTRVDRRFLDHVSRQTCQAVTTLTNDPGTGNTCGSADEGTRQPHADDGPSASSTDAPPCALVFLPGAWEVEQVAAHLRTALPQVEVMTLTGSMSLRDQDQVLTAPTRPRVVVATSIAESSLTVPGVRLVIDSGLAREPRLDRGRGMTGLVTVRESRAAAIQRSGRAARLGPGVAVRCLAAEDWAGMDAEPAPEIKHADLTGPLLTLSCWGAPCGEGMALPDPLPPDQVRDAVEQLRVMGAVDEQGRPTRWGRRLALVPTSPALARGLLTGAQMVGARAAAQTVAALELGERAAEADLPGLVHALRSGNHRASPQWRVQVRRLEQIARDQGSQQPGTAGASLAQPGRTEPGPTDHGRAGDAAGPTSHGAASPGGGSAGDADDAVALVVALARPQNVARQRGAGSRNYLLASGTAADLPVGSPLTGAQWLAVADVSRTTRRGQSGAVIRSAAPLAPEHAMQAAQGLEVTEEIATWQDGAGRSGGGKVQGRLVHRLGAIELSSTPITVGGQAARDAVVAALHEHGLGVDGHGVLTWSAPADMLRRRLGVLHRVMGAGVMGAGADNAGSAGGGWPDVGEAALIDRAREWIDLDAVAAGRPFSPAAGLRALLPWPQASHLDDLVPDTIEVPTGSHIRLAYPEVGDDSPPVLAVKLQECFGWTTTPVICDGRLPVLLHLLSPARRPLAVTDDLASFWANVYPQVRAENRGRYIKHPWPEDPLTATPMRGTTRSGR